ncbi:MAG: DTW domain-containing protein [Ignavibacteria bacterium]|nr:DTW domain-containing protein [Ignavibacteria bacterium]
MRPESHCLCSLLPHFRAQCNIAILQHPAERRKYHGTARMVTLAIDNARLKRCLYFAPGELEQMFEGQNPYILFPCAEAIDCEQVELTERDTVIAIDGTWSEAGKVLNRNLHLRS